MDESSEQSAERPEPHARAIRLGVLAGSVVIPPDIDVDNAEIAAEFGADDCRQGQIAIRQLLR